MKVEGCRTDTGHLEPEQSKRHAAAGMLKPGLLTSHTREAAGRELY
jgi:hypothetical protein